MDTTSYTGMYAPPIGPGSAMPRRDRAGSRAARRDVVPDRIRRMVLLGEFPTGERVVEERVAEALGVSRTPVREALVRLHAEGLLRRYADGGFYVAEPDLADLRDLYELRIALELRGLTRALEGFGSHDLAVLEPLRDRWRGLRDDPPAPDPTFVELDESFHMALCRSAGNVALAETLETVNARIRPVRMHDFFTEDRIALTIDQHLDITESVLAGKVERAVVGLRRHVGESMEVVERRAAAALTRMVLGRGRRR